MLNTADKSKSLLALTAVVASRVQIEGIRLAGCKTTSAPPVPGTPLRAFFGFQVETSADRGAGRIAVSAFFTVGAEAADGSGSPLVREFLSLHGAPRAGATGGSDWPSLPFLTGVEFHLSYRIDSFEGISDDHLDAFGKMNGIYNAWPYLREYVQSMTTRVGLPALTLPVLTGEAIQRMHEQAEAAGEAEGDAVVRPEASTAEGAS
jgi:hypothetical protein